MDQYRFGYHTDLLAQFPTIVAGAAFALGIDNQSEERAAEALLRAQVDRVTAQFATEPLSSHPHEVTLEKLGAIQTYRTDQHGSVEVVTDGAGYWVRTGR